MLTTEEALERVLARTRVLRPEWVALQAGLGRFLSDGVMAGHSLPRFDQSSMDGYAVAAEDCGAEASGRILQVVGSVAAGREATEPVGAGRAVRIFTGAPVPQGTAAVVMQEDVVAHADGTITIGVAPEEGEFIRRAGADMCAGQKVAEAGQFLTPQLLAVLAAQGLDRVSVGGVPRVGILSTGDELVPPGAALPSSATIYNSNGPMLEALVTGAGGACVRNVHAGDDPDALAAALHDLAEACDIVIISGGVSVGDHDHVRPALERAGFAMDFWKVRMKPGKPLAFGIRAERRLAFGLPGNPVSAFVTFWLFVFPALRRLMGAGAASLRLPVIHVRLSAAMRNGGDREHWVRGRVDSAGFAPMGTQESHALFSLSRANALVRVAPGAAFAEGASVEAHLLPGEWP